MFYFFGIDSIKNLNVAFGKKTKLNFFKKTLKNI
jgi:hypothetical protein